MTPNEGGIGRTLCPAYTLLDVNTCPIKGKG